MASCRKCSHCGGNGHNSRTCAERVGVRLFGVRISGDSCGSMAAMRKSASTGNLVEPSSCACDGRQDAYASDDLMHTTSNSRERKKGVPWTEEEHRLFLIALQKLGKGDWRGISTKFVKTRTPTQVASHAQKYFLRQSNLSKRRRRSSLFDITPGSAPAGNVSEDALQHSNPLHSDTNVMKESRLLGKMSVRPDGPTSVYAPREVNDAVGAPFSSKYSIQAYHQQFPGCKEAREFVNAAFLSYYCTWPRLQGYPGGCLRSESKLVKPIPISLTKNVNVDVPLPPVPEISTEAAQPVIERTLLSHELSENKPRHSAFHALTGPVVRAQAACAV